jgi:hypothetical protein
MFEDVTLSWKDETFTVPANEQMVLIAKLETALRGDSGRQPLSILMQKEGPSYGELARAYGAALRHAGAKVSDSEVYMSIQEDLTSLKGVKLTEKLQAATIAIISIMSPPLGHAILGMGDGKKPKKATKD